MPTADIAITSACRQMIRQGALIAVNASGGKDSQAMTILLCRIVPRHQLVIVHAPLDEAEWPGTINHIHDTSPPEIPLILAITASGKTLLQRVAERGLWPGVRQRYCTGDLKRTPIQRELRRYLKANPRFEGRLVNAMGIRRDESRDRAKRSPWQYNKRMSLAGHSVYDWLPLFELGTADVFGIIAAAGQSPHPIYAEGLSRCSCSFCIFGSRADLRRAAELRPALYQRYATLEAEIGHTLSPSLIPLPELTGVPIERPHPTRTR